MDKVVVDTSAWIDFFVHPTSTAATVVDQLLKDDLVCVTGVVIAELFQGARTAQSRETLLVKFQALPYLETSREHWVTAGLLAASLRQQGTTLPLTDVLIATVAQAHQCRIYTTDRHFTRIPHLTLYQPRRHTAFP